MGQAGIFPSPGLVSSRGMVAVAGVGPAVVGGRVPATVVGVVVGGVVLGPVVDARRGTVLATVGFVVAGALVVGGPVTGSVVAGASVVVVLMTCPAARPLRAPPANAAKAHTNMTATARARALPAGDPAMRGDDTRRCLLVRSLSPSPTLNSSGAATSTPRPALIGRQHGSAEVRWR
jgi:hypothetical protein